MTTELKIKVLVNLFLWLPIIWFLWNQAFKILMARKRIKILDKCNSLLKEANKLSSSENIDENTLEAKKLRDKEKIIWSEYEKLLIHL